MHHPGEFRVFDTITGKDVVGWPLDGQFAAQQIADDFAIRLKEPFEVRGADGNAVYLVKATRTST